MIHFFNAHPITYAVGLDRNLGTDEIEKLSWLFNHAQYLKSDSIQGKFIGPRKEMITPWSTNAVEITQNMGIEGITRIEEFIRASEVPKFDPMLKMAYEGLGQKLYTIKHISESVLEIEDIAAYNADQGLALSEDEIEYLEDVAKKIGRPLTDSEVFGFSQVNSEHCRHKIFNGRFIINGQEQEKSLFEWIKETSKKNPNLIESAYKDNVAFIKGPDVEQFAPKRQDIADFFAVTPMKSVISLKAETHNFPTTVEPFNGAATGSGGEIRDRMAGGTASLPLAGTAVYMTSYPRNNPEKDWENKVAKRDWLYQTPEQILIKASNGASDFGNKFGQPLICGSLLTFEHEEHDKKYAFDKVIMLAGGIGFAKEEHAQKKTPKPGDRIIVMGGDNYRIGMGGGAVSSVDTGEFDNKIELNAVQRSNPEMQKRVYNAIRAMAESQDNKIVSIHDHGAGGHLNSLSELVEESGGTINIENLPVGDPTLSAKEIIGNESQERMGLIISKEDLEVLENISHRERAPMYDVGEVDGSMKFRFSSDTEQDPINLDLAYMFGKPPMTVLEDERQNIQYKNIDFSQFEIRTALEKVLQIEAVACKDWLTNKVDRSVTGRIAMQQCTGPLQLPLNNLGIAALDYLGKKGIATSIGHAPAIALIDAEIGSRISIVESLTNIIWAPLSHGLKGVSLSANWMWPAKNEGENARLYDAVKSLSEYAQGLGINIPTGKDSLSMVQKYPKDKVYSPGTVIISATAEVSDIKKAVTPVLKDVADSQIIHIPFGKNPIALGGSSFAQTFGVLGMDAPDTKDAEEIVNIFSTVQKLISDEKILSGHDISSGGLITTLLEMCFPINGLGLSVKCHENSDISLIGKLFSENPGIIIQTRKEDDITSFLREHKIEHSTLGSIIHTPLLQINCSDSYMEFDIPSLRDTWFHSSYLLDKKQSKEKHADLRFKNYKLQELDLNLSTSPKANEQYPDFLFGKSKVKAAIIREKGVNGDREMAYSLYAAGFEVKDIHMTDLMTGRENLEDVQMIVFVGGFSNSDVLGSAKGWAGAFRYNEKARKSLENFYDRKDTLSLGVCNGCQLMMELGLITTNEDIQPKMQHNASGKFESAFLSVNIPENNSVMLKSLANRKLGVWVAHGEGKFSFPNSEKSYHIPMKYTHTAYPANPNGSDFATAAICTDDGRHLAMMPHLERSIFPWQWAHQPEELKGKQFTPWIEAFINAIQWIKGEQK